MGMKLNEIGYKCLYYTHNRLLNCVTQLLTSAHVLAIGLTSVGVMMMVVSEEEEIHL